MHQPCCGASPLVAARSSWWGMTRSRWPADSRRCWLRPARSSSSASTRRCAWSLRDMGRWEGELFWRCGMSENVASRSSCCDGTDNYVSADHFGTVATWVPPGLGTGGDSRGAATTRRHQRAPIRNVASSVSGRPLRARATASSFACTRHCAHCRSLCLRRC